MHGESNRDRVLKQLTVSVGFFAIASALLIGIGQMSVSVPILVTACVLLSWVYTDWLGWLRLHRYVVYIMMIAGSFFAILDYLNQSNHQQLHSVANLLVYAQLPLLFQTKSRRIFEQIGVFLLLELVVAALVNDDVFFGLLLIPTLSIGGWVMVLYATYVSMEQIQVDSLQGGRKGEWWSKLLGLQRKAPWEDPPPIARLQHDDSYNRQRPMWPLVGFPLSLGCLVFTCVFFYTLPRLNHGAYASTGLGQAMVGFSKTVSLEQLGKMLQSPIPVFRLQLHELQSGANYRMLEAPYIRGATLTDYQSQLGNGSGTWNTGDYERAKYRSLGTQLPPMPKESLIRENDVVLATFTEQSFSGEQAFGIPPFYSSSLPVELEFSRDSWQLSSDRSEEKSMIRRRTYQILTQAFAHGVQTPWVPESEAVFPSEANEADRSSLAPHPYSEFTELQFEKLTRFSHSRYRGLLAYRDRVFAERLITSPRNQSLEAASMLRDHLANSGEFSYTLDLTMKRDPFLDPIEDFIVNQKKGHCQLFASALCMLLRSEGIPARLVVGFRPRDYNEVGEYFLVKQSHAHAWVEAYFTREQIDRSTLARLPDSFPHGAWFRLDPTPPSGSNAGQSIAPQTSQTLDFAQQLWRDYVMNIDRSNQSRAAENLNELTQSLSEGWIPFLRSLFEKALRWIQSFINNPLDWFTWKTAGIFLAFLSLSWLAWRFGGHLLRFPWTIFKGRASFQRNRSVVSIPFFREYMSVLERMGLRRSPHQTHWEFANEVTEQWALASRENGEATPMHWLTRMYYEIRYGGKKGWTPDEDKKIAEAIDSVRNLASQKNRTKVTLEK